MEPIRGPLDYHRYPPRKKNTAPSAKIRQQSRQEDGHNEAQDTADDVAATPVVTSSAQRLHELRNRGGYSAASRSGASHHADDGEDEPVPSAPRLHMVNPSHVHAAHVMEAAHTPPDEVRERQPRRRRRGGQSSNARPFWKRVLRGVGFLLVIGWLELGAAALTTKHFAVAGVDTEGLAITQPQEVQPIAASLVGQNWIRARLHPVEEQIEALPAVRDAQVVRVWDEWPPRVAVRIQEREPFARVGGGNHWWVVDRDGVPFRAATKEDEKLYAVTASTLPGETIEAGKHLPPKLWKSVVHLADVLATQAQQGQQWQLRRTYIDKYGFASLRLEGGSHDEMLVRLGAGRWPEKLERARQALAYFEKTGRQAAALNLVSYSKPTWTPRVVDVSGQAPDIENEGARPADDKSTTESTSDGVTGEKDVSNAETSASDEESETLITDAT